MGSRVRMAEALLLALVAVGLLLGPQPTQAHTGGGQAQLYLVSARVDFRDGWWMEAVLRDLDSGRPEPGFLVEVRGTGATSSFGPVPLRDLSDGRYEGPVPLTEGRWALTVEGREIPGGSPALPFKKTWSVEVVAGQAIELIGRPAPGGSPVGGVLRLALIPVGLAGLLMVVRRGVARPRRVRQEAGRATTVRT